MERKKIEYLVADTGAFIDNAALQDLAENVVTCQEVVDEVTSKRQLRRLAVLPYELQIKDVFPENVKFVTEFAKKTGDYRSLSANDIKVIALTYQLEKEKVGADHLRQQPETQRTITFQNKPTVDLKDMAGFFVPTNKGGEERENGSVEEPDKGSVSESEANDVLSERLSTLECTDEGDDTESNESDDEDEAISCEDVDPSDVLVKVTQSSSTEENLSCNNEGNSEKDADDASDDNASAEENGDEDDEVGWITPMNVKEMKKKMNAQFEEEKQVVVACITMDFAMQNVLKQIGLNVSSIDGRVIRQLRTFILRCYACFKTTSIMTKAFCPHCGHKTLKRVAVSVAPDGSQKIHINLKKPLSTKGKGFSLPTFKGGKHSNNPVIFADQPMPDQRPTRLARTKTNIMDNDFIQGFSPFAIRDTTSKSAMLGIRGNQELKYWMRRNPNEAKPHGGRRKKK